eukprot:scaffold15580_cov20-Tisochrysis_lutea.AAC.2
MHYSDTGPLQVVLLRSTEGQACGCLDQGRCSQRRSLCFDSVPLLGTGKAVTQPGALKKAIQTAELRAVEAIEK